jgi:DNA modification methylase
VKSRLARPRLIDLTTDPHNANRGTERGREALARSLRDYGPGRAVLIDRHGRIIAGNKTVEQAKRLNIPLRVVKTDGHHLVAVQRADLDLATDPRAKALAIADNRVGEIDLEWDVDMLKQLQADGLNLSAFWTDAEFATLFAESTAGLSDENAVVEPGPTDIVRGELFVLGRHRLLCGDATSPADVARLLNGVTPVLMATDPPYGVSYDPAWRHRANPSQRTTVGRVRNDDRAEWVAAWQLFPGTIAYVWHAGLKAAAAAADLEAAGFTIRSQIMWQKQHFALSRGDYHWGHEPAWYAVRGRGRWRGDRCQSTVWEVANLNPMGGTRDADNAVTGHSTQKPVRLFEIPLLNHTVPGEASYDPFCGSGTAIIAAEKLGRVCHAMEIDPQYVQAAVTRWETFTGGESRQATGRPPHGREGPVNPPRRRRGRGGQHGHDSRARIRTREVRAMELAVLGASQHTIAEDLGISQPAVSKLLKRIETRLLRELAETVGRQRARQALRLEHVYAEAMRAWQESKADSTRRRQRKTQGGQGHEATVAEIVSENQHGDPQYLDEARRALADHRKLWGLDAPQKVDLRASRDPYDEMSEEALREAVAQQARLLGVVTRVGPDPDAIDDVAITPADTDTSGQTPSPQSERETPDVDH